MGVPPAEIAVDEDLVRGLLRDQHPDLADLPLELVAGGWDNDTWRLGDALAVRVPRRAFAVELIELEQRWLPVLAPALPVPVPAPVRVGGPGADYPWPWSVVPWFAGRTAAARTLSPAGARALGDALHALHVPSAADAPRNPYRSVALAGRPDPLEALEALCDREAPRPLTRCWRRALAAAPAPTTLRWIHGDLHARNLIVAADGGLAAIIDWGDVAGGDPAVDLSVLWTVLEPGLHGAFCAGYGPVEGALLDRARGWALCFGVIFAALEDDPDAAALGRLTLTRLQE
ncbi:MAG: serine/threonine protein kinase [Solirubrobacterales bacterium]|nr:serine/threonine protein kinase [Solirubrobacterales bacterium]